MTGITHLNNAAMGLEANREPGSPGTWDHAHHLGDTRYTRRHKIIVSFRDTQRSNPYWNLKRLLPEDVKEISVALNATQHRIWIPRPKNTYAYVHMHTHTHTFTEPNSPANFCHYICVCVFFLPLYSTFVSRYCYTYALCAIATHLQCDSEL